MGDCNLNLSYKSSKNDDKYCKYSYLTWCPTCERNSPRRRSKSETNEPCRRKCKEMKTLTPKKFGKSQEYENMDLDYVKPDNSSSPRYECCRIRSNLCELPTSYISNNCQTFPAAVHLSNMPSKLSGDADFSNCLKSIKTYEQTLKFVDVNNQTQFGVKMQEKSPIKHAKSVSDHKHISYLQQKSSKLSKSPQDLLHNTIQNNVTYDNHYFGDYRNANNHRLSPKSNCKECCPFIEFQMHDLANRRSVCYDTCTYFNRSPPDTTVTADLQDRYGKEVEFLREKLRLITKNCCKELQLDSIDSTSVKKHNANGIKDQKSTKPTVVCKTKRDRKYISPQQSLKCSPRGVKLGARVKSSSSGKFRKMHLKKPSSLSSGSDFTGSDCSRSDESDIEDGILDDEGESTIETLSPEESNKDSSDTTISVGSQHGAGDTLGWPIRPSLFPYIPPYIRFNSHDSEVAIKIPNGRKFLKWKLSTITPIVVRKTLTNSGFSLVRKSNQWMGTWGKHMKSPLFKTLKDMQKLNHFPGTFQLGRKDKLWRNFQRLINKFGLKEFGFLPHTYILPFELKLLKQNWEFKNGGGDMWIIKPPAAARGVGIKVINKWSHLPKKTSIIVQKYISNPYLINGSKFDLRLYVLVTSFHPLRIYLYPDGLARFASAKYSDDIKDLKDRYMHLTNYSINKLSSQYTANEDANACQGHKWTISKLMEYLQMRKVDTKALWKNLQQLVIKTILSAEAPITQLCDENMNSIYNCYELFGIDVLLDEHLKPWLLEVNISPSLHSASPLDAHVKGPLVQTLFDMAQFHFPQKLGQTVRQSPQCFDPRLYTTSLTKKERNKHLIFTQFEDRCDYLRDILRDLTGDDVRQLTRAEDEYSVKGRFERIFPTANTFKYLHFMEVRYYNRLFDAWEVRYGHERQEGINVLKDLCAEKIHLKVASQTSISKNAPNTIRGDTNLHPSREEQSRPLEELINETSITFKISTSSS